MDDITRTGLPAMPSQSPSAWTLLAHLLRPQGRKGEILAELHIDFPERFDTSPRVYLAKPGFTGDKAEARAVDVIGHWQPVGRNHGRIVLHIAGIDSITAAEQLSGLDVIIPREDRTELPEDEEYVEDLIGCEVFDKNTRIGTVIALDFPASPDGSRRLPGIAPILTVETPTGEEILIPYVQSFLLELSVEKKRIAMSLPEGLLDLNR